MTTTRMYKFNGKGNINVIFTFNLCKHSEIKCTMHRSGLAVRYTAHNATGQCGPLDVAWALQRIRPWETMNPTAFLVPLQSGTPRAGGLMLQPNAQHCTHCRWNVLDFAARETTSSLFGTTTCSVHSTYTRRCNTEVGP
eukprot:m.193515 g.193515  ORF g.193515 m.193515 type:complete len:139 (+) comp18636_c0_seq6:238-654(+)